MLLCKGFPSKIITRKNQTFDALICKQSETKSLNKNKFFKVTKENKLKR